MSFGDGIGDLKQALSALIPASKPQAPPRTEVASADGRSVTGSGTQADEASLSKAGGLIAQVFGGSDVRTAKVEALQQAIASGGYGVSSSEIAGKIIQSLLD
jgi:negative regulator of flagellin synthesis FlgM